MFAGIEALLERADRGCQLWDHEVAGASQLIVNTLYFLELDFFQRCAAERARVAIVAYASTIVRGRWGSTGSGSRLPEAA
jgi:hypothetical protein